MPAMIDHIEKAEADEKKAKLDAKTNRKQKDADHAKAFEGVSEEDLAKQQNEFLSSFGFSTPKKDQPEEKTDDKTTDKQKEEQGKAAADAEAKKKADAEAEAKKAKEAAAAAPVEGEEKLKKPKGKPIPVEDTEEFADKVAERLAAKVQTQPDASTVERTASDTTELVPEEKAILSAVERLQKEKRFEGRNLVKETTDFWKKEESYAAQWEKDNQGEQFDQKDPEHAAFYQRNKPSYEANDLAQAQEAIRTEEIERRAEERVLKRVQPQLQEIKAKEAIREAAPVIQRARDEAVLSLVSEAVPEFKDTVEASGILDAETIGKLKALNPAALDLLDQEAGVLRVQVEELEKLTHLSAYYQPDPNMRVRVEDNMVMPIQDILEAGSTLEDRIASQPQEEQVFEGKTFITRAELRQKIASIQSEKKSPEEKQARIDRVFDTRWFIETIDIRNFLVKKSAKRVQRVLAHVKTSAPAKKEEVAAAREEKVKPAESRQSQSHYSKAPAAAAASDNVNTQLTRGSGDPGNDKVIASKMWGR